MPTLFLLGMTPRIPLVLCMLHFISEEYTLARPSESADLFFFFSFFFARRVEDELRKYQTSTGDAWP